MNVTQTGLASIDQIKDALTRKVDALARDLLPDGGFADSRREWAAAPTARGGLGDSMKVRLSGPKAGLWIHGAAGEKGDIIALIAYLQTGNDQAAAVRWAMQWLGWDGAGVSAPARRPAQAVDAPAAEARQREAEADTERRHRHAQAMWLAASSNLAGTPVDRYLAGRGISLKRLAELGTVPGALRYAADLVHSPERKLPALVAAVTRPPVNIVGGVTTAIDPPARCRFYLRCPIADEFCRDNDQPPLEDKGGGRLVACYKV